MHAFLVRKLVLAGLASGSALYLALGAAFSFFTPPHATADPASNLSVIAYAGDSWENYDFTSPTWDANGVDWPLRFVFYNNAEVDYVKNKIDGCNGDPSISPTICNTLASAQYFWTYDTSDSGGNPTSWLGYDADSGLKQTIGCSWYYTCEFMLAQTLMQTIIRTIGCTCS